MAKKTKAKRGAPQKTCVKCGKLIHVKRKECDCGAKQPVRAKPTAKKPRTRTPLAEPTTAHAPIVELLDVVGRLGGVDSTIEILNRIKGVT